MEDSVGAEKSWQQDVIIDIKKMSLKMGDVYNFLVSLGYLLALRYH